MIFFPLAGKCSAPHLTNGRVFVYRPSDNGWYSWGTVARFECHASYTLTGPDVSVCVRLMDPGLDYRLVLTLLV